MTLKELMKEMDAFVRAKGWYEDGSLKEQTPENLAKSICIEAAELLECYQWNTLGNRVKVAEELADIMLYVMQLANVIGLDIEQAVKSKIIDNYKREWRDG